MENKVILYTTGCPKCEILERKLKEKDIHYEVCSDKKVMISKKMVSAPQLEVIMDFGSAVQWVNKIEEGN